MFKGVFMEKIDYDKLIDMINELSSDSSNIDKYFKNASNYEFDSHSNMLCFLLALYKYKSSMINLNDFNISKSDDFEYYEFLRRIDHTIMCAYCIENKNLKQEAIYYFYLDYIHINYIINDYAEIIRTCKNMELIFLEDDKLLFYKLLYLYDNIYLLTSDVKLNESIFLKEFERYLYEFEKSEIKINHLFYSSKINIFNDFYNSINENDNTNIVTLSEQNNNNHLLLNYLTSYNTQYHPCKEIQEIQCPNTNIQELANSLIKDYFYERNRFSKISESEFIQNEILSIEKGLFSIYDKIAYILLQIYQFENRTEKNTIFNPNLFIEAKLNNKTRFIDLPNPFIKTLYLYSLLYALDSEALTKKSIFSIGNWNYSNERNISEHRSTCLIPQKKESSLITLFCEIRNCILVLIKLIKFEFPTTTLK